MSAGHPEVSIAERMADCLRRQIAAFQQAQADLEALGQGGNENDDGAIATQEALDAQQAHLKHTIQLEEELRLLLPDWHEADPPPSTAERGRIAELAAEAQALADALQLRYESGRERARALADSLRQDMDALRVKRTPLRYHPNPDDGPRTMDRKA